MKAKINIWLFLAFSCVLSIGYFAGHYPLKKERALNVANLTAYRDTIRRYSVKIGGLENFISMKNALIMDQKAALRAGVIERDRLKALHLKEVVTNTNLKGTIQILRDSLKLVPGTVIVTIKDTSGITHDYIKIPFTLIDEKTKYLSLLAGMDSLKFAYYSLQVPVSGELSIGYQRDGLLKTRPVGIFTSENPYLTINSMDVLIIKENKKFYQRTWFHIFAGAIIAETVHQFFK